MDQVMVRAKVSRATLYSNFADKSELLAAVIAAESKRIVTDDWAHDNLDQPIECALIEYGENLIDFLIQPETIAFERLIFQVALSEPAHGLRAFEAGPGRVNQILAALVRAGQDRGELRIADAGQAVDDLLGLLLGMWHVKLQYDSRQIPDKDEVQRLARHGVRQFLELYAARE